MNWPNGFAGKSVLVTGATGMLGQRLVAALRANGAKISLLSRDAQQAKKYFVVEGVDIIQADLTLPKTLSGVCSGVDTVFHLASYPGAKEDLHIEEDPKHFDVTLEGTRHLIAEAKRSGVKQIAFASSVRASDSKIDLNSYAQAKRQAETLLLESASNASFKVSILRFPAIYGSIERGNIARMISAIDRGSFPPIPEFSNRRSMIHLDDAVRALLMAAHSEEMNGKIYTVTDGESYSTRRLYCSIMAALGKPLPAWYLPEPVLQVLAYIGDSLSKYFKRPLSINSQVLEKLRGSAEYDGTAFVEEIDFKPYYNLEFALPKMVSRFRSKLKR
jgi:nucleoside-diphosphate-sugar epimerase